MNIELIRVVYSDLRHILEEWKDISDDELRRGSSVLRSLLMHDNLQKAWNQIGFTTKCSIDAPGLEAYTNVLPPSKIRMAFAGGALYKGVRVFSNAITSPLSDDEAKELTKLLSDQTLLYHSQSLGKFKETPVIILNQTSFTRGDIINFVSNKLGGAHFDEKRDGKSKMLDQILTGVTMLDKNAIYYELLAIGQFLVNSDDIRAFLTECERVLAAR